ncbi:MAG: ABC transporter ATP-binding protein [Alphaproteobacteria bacterium]|nr:ABC transporter ATP-binding protein [Alphaproteobacteria bacterium]
MTQFPKNAIEIEGLTKFYARSGVPALDHIDLVVPQGSLFGLLGPNGAGKSTLINVLGNLVLKTEGQVRIWDRDLDEDPRGVRSALGIVPQELNVDSFFTVRELLEFQAGLYGVPKHERITDDLLTLLELSSKAHTSTHALSGGMKRRLMMAKAMAHRPPVLILDEPTAGVDVDFRHALWTQLRKLNEAGTTIVLTTHYLEEAQSLCDHIAILHQGRFVANDSTEHLLQQLDNKSLTVTVDRDLHDVPPNLRPHGWVLENKRQLKLTRAAKTLSIGQMLLAVQVNGLNILDIVTKEPDLEDVFFQLTKRA